jgi:hypothetical protein
MDCKITECKSKATYGFKFAQPEYCIKHGREKGAKTQFGVCVCGESTPRFAAPDEKASCCAKCKTKDMRNVADRHCKCGKHLPTYGMPEDKRAEYCSKCLKPGMINLKDKNKKCPCGKIPTFAFKGKKKECCINCKKEGMVNVVNIMCPCGKSAAFGMKGDKKPTCCLKCKKEGMENILTKKCKCGKAVPVFALKGSKKPLCCVSCKTDDMINVTHYLCLCNKAQPSFGFKGDKRPTCCVSCAKEGMENILDRKCLCGKSQPHFGLKNDTKPNFCKSCRTSEMINLKAKMCGCGRAQPVFGLRTDKKPTCCVICKSSEMIDIMSPKCRGLINYNGKGDIDCPYENRCKPKYDNYCTKCFEQNFPDDPRTALICKNSKELEVKRFLSNEFKEFIHDKPLWTGQADCTCRRRIDFRWLIGNTLLCVEVDEDQHKYRNRQDELTRYDDLMMLHGGKFIFIRYNPDIYIDKNGKRKNPEIPTRLASLKTSILQSIQRIEEEDNDDLVEIDNLFFDEI